MRSMTKIYIDADACPVIRESLAIARAEKIPCIIAGNTTQNLERHMRPQDPREPRDPKHPDSSFWTTTLQESIGADSADFAIASAITPEDIVVTQDIGLADIVHGRRARAIGVRGRIYNPLTIDSMMFIRHEEKKVRRQGGRTKGPAPFTNEDRKRFERNLRQLVHEAKQPQSKSID